MRGPHANLAVKLAQRDPGAALSLCFPPRTLFVL